MQGHEVIRTISLNNKTYALYRHAIKDYSGNVFGVLDIAMDRTHSEQAIADIRLKLILIGLVALVIGTAIAWFIAKGITRPIAETTQAMNDIAEGEGDLTRRIAVKGKDEIAELSMAFNRFVEKFTTQFPTSPTQQACSPPLLKKCRALRGKPRRWRVVSTSKPSKLPPQ